MPSFLSSLHTGNIQVTSLRFCITCCFRLNIRLLDSLLLFPVWQPRQILKLILHFSCQIFVFNHICVLSLSVSIQCRELKSLVAILRDSLLDFKSNKQSWRTTSSHFVGLGELIMTQDSAACQPMRIMRCYNRLVIVVWAVYIQICRFLCAL